MGHMRNNKKNCLKKQSISPWLKLSTVVKNSAPIVICHGRSENPTYDLYIFHHI